MPAGAAMLDPLQEERYATVASRLRCPVCNGESIAESSTAVSEEMKVQVRQMIAEGKSNDAIYKHFEDSYGSFILLDPPKKGSNLILWALPWVSMGAGWLLLNRAFKRLENERGSVRVAAELERLKKEGT